MAGRISSKSLSEEPIFLMHALEEDIGGRINTCDMWVGTLCFCG